MDEFFGAAAQSTIKIPVGEGEDGEVSVEFSCNYMYTSEAVSNCVVFGCVGSGKTTFLNNLAQSACKRYSSDAVGFWLWDASGRGALGWDNIQNTRIDRALSSDVSEEGYALLKDCFEEALRRDMLFGGCVSNVAEYNKKIYLKEIEGEPLPRIIFIINDLDIFLESASINSDLYLDGIVGKDGRLYELLKLIDSLMHASKLGIHLVVGISDVWRGRLRVSQRDRGGSRLRLFSNGFNAEQVFMQASNIVCLRCVNRQPWFGSNLEGELAEAENRKLSVGEGYIRSESASSAKDSEVKFFKTQLL